MGICTLGIKDGKPNYCVSPHEFFHPGHYAEYAVDPGPKGEMFRALWDRQKQEQSHTKNLIRSWAVAKQCIYLGNRLTKEEVDQKQLVGCRTCTGQVPAFHCKLPGARKFNDGPYTRIAECLSCPDFQKPAIPWQPITTRHLLYHIYPVQNGHWQWNVEQLCGRLKAFNGQKIVAIVTDPPSGRLPDPSGPNSPDNGRHIPGCDTAEMVKEEFSKRTEEEITFLEMTNDPSLREVKTFVPMLERVISDDPSHSLLYAQAKGTTRHNGHIARRWTEALYEIMFDYFPLADEQLMTYPVTGCFKKLGHGWSPDQSKSDWHYSGSWFWVRTAELENRNWQKIDQFWSGIEPYPSQQFNAKEAGCMFHTDHVPNMNLYNGRYWRRVVLPAFDQWRIDNAKYRTEMWPR